jgi:hemerythrin-like domain-containing protein
MRITNNFRTDQDLILRFLNVLGGGAAILSSSKRAAPGFFISAHSFMEGYIEGDFFKREDLLITALEDNGFSASEAPIATMRTDQIKSRDSAGHMVNASKGWLGGDEEARGEVGWAASDYTSTMRQHLDRLKTRVLPLLEQNMSPDDENKFLEGFSRLSSEKDSKKEEADKYVKLIELMENELNDWN